jgi:hypothetical protein
VTHEEGDFNQLRAQLGNDIATKAYREGRLPFPDGAILVALHWKRDPSDEDNQVFGRVQASVAGSPINMQVMVKDSKRYAATGGWGFGDFKDGKPSDEALHQKCFLSRTGQSQRLCLHRLRTLIAQNQVLGCISGCERRLVIGPLEVVPKSGYENLLGRADE